MSQKTEIPRDKIGLEKFIASLTSENSGLEARAETLRSEYAKQIQAGNPDAALAAKREAEAIPVKVEILNVKIESAKARLSVLLSNEPKALQLRGEIAQNWKALAARVDAVDAGGETVRRDFAAIKDLEKKLYSLLGDYYMLIGVPMPAFSAVPLTFCEKLPGFLEYPARRLSEFIFVYRPSPSWEPLTRPPPQE
mgnify:CR=1 FL=1